MSDDPLYQALGAPGAAGPAARGGTMVRWIAAVVLLGLAGGAAVLVLRRPGHATDPGVAVARIEIAPKPAPLPVPPAPPAPAAADASSVSQTVEIQHGVKIIRLGPAASPASVKIAVADATPVRLRPAPDPRLVEATRFGALPRIGSDGARPADIYARPAPPAGPGAAPRIAIVAAGMGLDQMRTAQASRGLPPAVTLAFAPEGPDLPAQVSEARTAGHEVVLDLSAVPPADPPATEPVLDRLHRRMGRFAGYAGVALSGETGDDAATTLGDIAARGLYAIDANAAPAGDPTAPRADVLIEGGDAGVTSTALGRLAPIARAKGSALGVIGRGADADALASFASGLSAQGIDLVPASALAKSARTPAAAR